MYMYVTATFQNKWTKNNSELKSDCGVWFATLVIVSDLLSGNVLSISVTWIMCPVFAVTLNV